jgi:hypothetical protein
MANSICDIYKNKTDELYTPKILVDIIQPYVDSKYNSYEYAPIIWLPFDTEQSEFVYMCKDNHYNYVASHINTGKDFFEWEPEKWDFIISNPPFSKKLQIFKKLVSIGKPFALIMNAMILNYMEITNFFADYPIQLLFVDKRVSFNGNPSSFASCYVCKDFLPEPLIFRHIAHTNSGKNFVPSRMYANC